MAESKKTVYVVLRKTDDETWMEDGPHQSAHSQTGAMEQAAVLRAENDLDGNGQYLAVPLSSWKPGPVTIDRKITAKAGT